MSEPRLVLELLGDDSVSAELPAAGTLVIGCSPERAGFVVAGQGVDDAHCAIGRTKEGDWAVKDLGSRNGTLLNGQRVSSARLKLGDQIVLGSRRLEVRAAPDEALRRAAPNGGRPSDVPQRIGGYRIERLIGKGAMGSVYLAVQESLRRPVALKVLSPRLAADRDFVHRFQAEARAAAALSHPNVVVVYDVGEENGAHYLSMEFMAGGSLEQKLAASGPLPWKAVLGVLGDAAAGLAYAESRGIVHRDIKPANLMYSGTGTVKIADLGLATTLEQEASEAGDGRKVFGTPHFISPEQARGEAVDHRSDLYSLGATVYRLLSGRTSFEGATTREILRALQSEEPHPLEELVSDLPADLGAVITRLMAKAPAARFPTAESLRRECERLRLVAEHGPALGQRTRASRAQRWVGALLFLVVTGAAAAWYLSLPKNAPETPRDDRPAALESTGDPRREDPSFFDGPTSPAAAPDEEQALRAREHEAAAELGALSPLLEPEERRSALQRIADKYPGTASASAALGELAALAVQPGRDASEKPADLEDALQSLRKRAASIEADGRPRALARALREIDEYPPEASLAPSFEGPRAELAAALVHGAEEALQAAFARATALALEGKFQELRALLATLPARFDGLEDLAADPARLARLLELRSDLEARTARVDDEERFFLENAERARRLAIGSTLGPGSGLLAELAALDFTALDQRLALLAPELRERPLCRELLHELDLAHRAVELLRKEFAGGGWRRKALLDPRSKKVREVRDLRPDGLVFDKEGGLENVSWREARCDPEWWHQLFQARLVRSWSPEEVRGILALLRLMGAARGAELACEGFDAQGRRKLEPAELQALENSFAPTAVWLEGASGDALLLKPVIERERAAARRVAGALEAAQQQSWSRAAAELERLLGEETDSLLVGLLSDGSDWQVKKPPPATAGTPTDGALGTAKPGTDGK